MNNYTSPSTTYNRSVLVVPQIITALAGGLVIFTLLMGVLALGYSSYYADSIYPGVWVAGIQTRAQDDEVPCSAAGQIALLRHISRSARPGVPAQNRDRGGYDAAVG